MQANSRREAIIGFFVFYDFLSENIGKVFLFYDFSSGCRSQLLPHGLAKTNEKNITFLPVEK